MHHKSIVCDLDDTISFCQDRNFANALPNTPVINKINELYEQGWEIHIVTARGCISCSTRSEADAKYRQQIEEWLNKNGVKYHDLSFNKQLAAYYVDDKALRPDEFAVLEIKNLQDGWSGATVELRGNLVYKTAPNSYAAAAWYHLVQDHHIGIFTPEVHSVIGDTICLQYIEPEHPDESSESEIDASKVMEALYAISKMKQVKKVPVSDNSILNYIPRLTKHSEKFKESDPEMFEIAERCINAISELNTKYNLDSEEFQSLCHGDMTLENVIISYNNGEGYFIDPIYEPNSPTYSSWLLDISKLVYSTELHGYNFLDDFEQQLLTTIGMLIGNLNWKIINEFIISHCIRVYNYAPDTAKPKIKNIAKHYESKRI